MSKNPELRNLTPTEKLLAIALLGVIGLMTIGSVLAIHAGYFPKL